MLSSSIHAIHIILTSRPPHSMGEGQQISWTLDTWRSETISSQISSYDSYPNMLFIYKLHISYSQQLQKKCQKNGGMEYNYLL